MVNHIRNCPHQSLETKARATNHRETSPQQVLPLLSAGPGIHTGSSFNIDPSLTPMIASGHSLPPSPAPSALAFLNIPSPFSGSPNYPNSLSLNSPTASSSSSHISRTRSASNGQVRRVPLQIATTEWTNEKQEGFEMRLARATASAGIPLAWVDNPDVEDLIEFLQPAAKIPSRKVLTKRIIPRVVNEFRQRAKAEAKGHNATLESDGWTGVNHHHFVSFMISVNGKVSLMRLFRLIGSNHCPSYKQSEYMTLRHNARQPLS